MAKLDISLTDKSTLGVDMRMFRESALARAGLQIDRPNPCLSVIVPCYNEQDCLPIFMRRMSAAAESAVASDFEIILVNDGSRDQTWSCIAAMTQRYDNVIGVNLARNHGHQLAVTAGLSLARGDQVMIIDADLQDPPELLSEMRTKMEEGFDVVYARRRTRARESQFKIVTARLFYRVLMHLSEVDIPSDTGDFRLMSRRIADQLNAMPEHDRFLRGMVAWLGGRQAEVLYDRDPRYAGKTGYSLAKMLKLAVNGLIGFSVAPLNFAVFLALLGALIGVIVLGYALVSFLLGNVLPGWTSLAMMTVFFGTGQFVCLGILGAYLGRTYMEVKHRPLFLIDEIAASPSKDSLE
jgi:dolichol-phosphate mannosyltransferase